jgi:hypothetical protein
LGDIAFEAEARAAPFCALARAAGGGKRLRPALGGDVVMDGFDDRTRDLREQWDLLLHDLEDTSRGANFSGNDDNITDRIQRRCTRMLLQIDAALADFGDKRQKAR